MSQTTDDVQREGSNELRKRERSRLTLVLAVAALVFLALWAWTELRLLAERETTRSVEAEKGALEQNARRSAVRDRLHERRSGVILPGLAKVRMFPPGGGPTPRGRVYVDHSGGRVFGFFSGLDRVTGGMTYQLWFLPAARPPESLGRLVFDEEGEAVMTSSGFPSESATGQLRLTLEQTGGALVPTGREILRGTLEATSEDDASSSEP